MKEWWKFFWGLTIGGGIVLIVAVFILFSVAGISLSNKIAIVNIRGTIMSSPQLLTETVTPDDMFSIIESIEQDPSVKAVLFKINSPGGSAVASREIAYAVKDIEKPTVCWMADVAASGAYWIASTCDHVMADPLSITGSIGATSSYIEFSELFEKYGITYEQITSGESKDMGSPFRNATEEEREKLQYMTNEIFNYFLEDVIKNRGLSDSQVEQIKTGDVFLGKDAVGIGLIDSTGTIKDAKEKVKELSGFEYVEFVTLKKKGLGLFELLGMF